MCNTGTGLFEQIKESNKVGYQTLTSEVLDDYLEGLDKVFSKQNNRFFEMLMGETTGRYLTAVLKDDKQELKKIQKEMEESSHKDRTSLSKRSGLSYELLTQLDKIFTRQNTYRSDLCWEVLTNNLGEDEYDDSYETFQITYDISNKLWHYSKYWSDGHYETKEIFKTLVTLNKVNELIKEQSN